MPQILIIDDDPTIRMTLQRFLKSQGYDVVIAKDGEEGLIKARELNPSLIICDWMMPILDGLEVCRQIKSSVELSHIYLILLTARDQEGDLVRGLEMGADDFLSKPPRINELRARVRAGLRLYQATEEIQRQKRLIEQELSQASQYVRSLLPAPIEGSISIQSSFLPSTQLGGDSFDYFWLDKNHLALYLLDVSGHGVGSALLSVSVLNLMRTRSLRRSRTSQDTTNFYSPSEVLQDLNNTFQMSVHNEMYFTIWYGVYDKQERKLIYASGGHPPAVLISNQEIPKIKLLKTAGLPIGMMPDINYQEQVCEIDTSSRLYLFSDGVYEIPQEDDSIWGFNALIDTFIRTPSDRSSRIDHILACVKEAAHNRPFEDDLSLLEVEFHI
ncbi:MULTISPECIES: PP2C family protein-serine/threonine phosphatase [Pseudanabaena]|uniref:Response regulator receiver modulated serine phosphatase n=2 Tax=Pseudanabaena TaxID=1152 RepID=L8N1S3_9CYAN|nr:MULTISPECIES: SpoIIE family protein phosphatase [Pseudanabaena]ELS34152.1 response regulator receiver modulated serine phosphatase [Pseudanabaena biceps PCC 7429]MDG3493626.1 SpoIIE family protein phosphatase [Pseudanabaena catenata USMAC16]